MFVMCAKILIKNFNGDILKGNISSCKWKNSASQYRNTAEIILPGRCKNPISDREIVQTSNLIKPGMFVKLEIGYNENYKLRFSGFVDNTNMKNHLLVISCEGYSYQLRNKEFTASYKNPYLKDLLNDLINGTEIQLSKNIPEVQLMGSVVFKKGKTGLDAIDYIIEKCGLTVYFHHNILYVGLKYFNIGRDINFQIGWNTVNVDSLIYKDEQKHFSVFIEYRKRDGTKISIASGKGEPVREEISHIQDDDFLKRMADEKALKKNPGNYSGILETFLEPFTEPFDNINITDKHNPDRKGKYFVDTVEGTFSNQGGRQKINIGIRTDSFK